MTKTTSSTTPEAATLQLKSHLASEGSSLKEKSHLAYQHFKPISLLKSKLREVVGSKEITNNLISAGAALTVGYFTKALLRGVTNTPMKKLLGTILTYGMMTFVAKHPATVKSFGNAVLNLFRNKPRKREQDAEKNGADDTSRN